MSIATCANCGDYVDTDFNTSGIWLHGDYRSKLPFGFICARCTETLLDTLGIECVDGEPTPEQMRLIMQEIAP